MMMRFALQCESCEATYWLRVGLGPTRLSRFYFACPGCEVPTRGSHSGTDPDNSRYQFDARMVDGNDFAADAPVVAVDPTMPSAPRGDSEKLEVGTFTTMTLLQLAGDERATYVMGAVGRGREVVDELWPKVRRVYLYYLSENWQHFDKAVRDLDPDYEPVATAHERATIAHNALVVASAQMMDGESDAAMNYLRRYHQKHTAALRNRDYVGQAQSLRDSGDLRELQRGMFDCLDRFFSTYDSWHLGILGRHVMPEQRTVIDGLVLQRDEFDVLRDLYQQGFEQICKTLRFSVAAQNTVKRKHPDDFGPDIPAGVDVKFNPSTIKAFGKLANAWKIGYVRQVPGFEGFADLLNNKTRNAIGHASARHDLRTGRIVSATDPVGMTYMQLVTDVFGMFEALGISVQVVRSQDVVSSPDFNISRPAK